MAESSHLIEKQHPRYVEEKSLHPIFGTSSPATSYGFTNAHNPAINKDAERELSSTIQSQMSATSFGASILGPEADPRDMQELLGTLDKATRLLRKHLQEENNHV